MFFADLFGEADLQATILYVRPTSEPVSVGESPLKEDTGMLADYGISAHPKIREGEISREILTEVNEGGYDLLVLGSRGGHELLGIGDLLLSETADQILPHCQTSLLVVKEPKPLHKILIATDGSQDSQSAIRLWGSLKTTGEPRVNVVNVVPEIYSHFRDFLEPVSEAQLEVLGTLPGERTKYLYQAKDALAEFGMDARVRLREGHAAEEILKESQRDYDLILMGLRGRKAHKKGTPGRQTIRVIQRAKMPILAVGA